MYIKPTIHLFMLRHNLKLKEKKLKSCFYYYYFILLRIDLNNIQIIIILKFGDRLQNNFL